MKLGVLSMDSWKSWTRVSWWRVSQGNLRQDFIRASPARYTDKYYGLGWLLMAYMAHRRYPRPENDCIHCYLFSDVRRHESHHDGLQRQRVDFPPRHLWVFLCCWLTLIIAGPSEALCLRHTSDAASGDLMLMVECETAC